MCPVTNDQLVLSPPSSHKHRGWFADASTPCTVTPRRDETHDDISGPATPPLPAPASPQVEEEPSLLDVCILLDYASQALLLDRLPAKHHVVMGDRCTLRPACHPSTALLAPLGTRLQLTVTAAATDNHCQVALLKGVPRWLATMVPGDAPPHLVLSSVPGCPPTTTARLARMAQRTGANIEQLLCSPPVSVTAVVAVRLADGRSALTPEALHALLHPSSAAPPRSLASKQDEAKSDHDQHRASCEQHSRAAEQLRHAAKRCARYERYDEAAAMRREAEKHAELAYEARRATNEAAFLQRNTRSTGHVPLDLHYMNAAEGVATLKRYVRHLAVLEHPGGWCLRDKRGVLRSAVLEYLEEEGHVYRLEPNNPGSLEISL